jgi:SAM-dependent methyltransferase
VSPQPTQEALAAFYASGYFEGSHDLFQGMSYIERRDQHIRDGTVTGWADVKALQPAGRRVLDLGCASGALLVLAREAGAAVVKGVELDPAVASEGRRRYGLDILVGEVTAVLAAESERFDIVSAFDLVEHVKEPRRLFAAIGGVLAPGGHFVCSVPNGECIDDWGSEWSGMQENMEHLQYLRENDLRRLGESADLTLVRIVRRGFPLRLSAYTRPSGSRLARALGEPGAFFGNAWTKWRVRRSPGGERHELAAVFSKAP